MVFLPLEADSYFPFKLEGNDLDTVQMTASWNLVPYFCFPHILINFLLLW